MKLLCANLAQKHHFFIIPLKNCVGFPFGATSSWGRRKGIFSPWISVSDGAPPVRGALWSRTNGTGITEYLFMVNILFLDLKLILGLQSSCWKNKNIFAFVRFIFFIFLITMTFCNGISNMIRMCERTYYYKCSKWWLM